MRPIPLHTRNRCAAALASGLLLAAALPAQAEGLALDGSSVSWATRLQVSPQAGGLGLRLYGDYYLDTPRFGEAGGVRLTSGLLVGSRRELLGAFAAPRLATAGVAFGRGLPAQPLADAGRESTLAWPYLGVGYTGISVRGGWGFTADFGLAAQQPALDDLVREMRLRPLLQLGVSYTF